jgi:hypothetical protein
MTMSNPATLEPARAGRATEIRYSPITHGYHLYGADGEMRGNVYGYESYLDAKRADSDICLTCTAQTEDVICPTCVESAHRCSEGHALGDGGECAECDAENERIRQEAYALNMLPETDDDRRLLEFGRQIIQQLIAERFTK